MVVSLEGVIAGDRNIHRPALLDGVAAGTLLKTLLIGVDIRNLSVDWNCKHAVIFGQSVDLTVTLRVEIMVKLHFLVHALTYS